MAIIAILSDIPVYTAHFISQITGLDMTEFVNAFNEGFAYVIELFEKILA